jgi:hypothetical protein
VRLVRAAVASALLALAACQSAPPAATGTTASIGNTTVTTSGSVGIDAAYVK